VDRVSIRSFRAADLAARGLKDLARSRLDTAREVVFEPLGARFFDAREDAARIATLFREDGFHAPEGHFTRMSLRLEPRLAEQLGHLAPRAWRRGWPRRRGTRSCASGPGRRVSTSSASSLQRAATSSPWPTSS
jgi:hypothetical protein